MTDPARHEMSYLAGVQGEVFGLLDQDPGWVCSCGKWFLPRSLTTGHPFRNAAEQAHRRHRREVGA